MLNEITGKKVAIDPDILALNEIIRSLPKLVETKIRLSEIFKSIHAKMNQGIFYQDILDYVFSTLDAIIPYDRIGIALLEDGGTRIRLNWVRSKSTITALKKDYVASMKDSSLQQIIDSEQPRIINNLAGYLQFNPNSKSTKLALMDGINSSFTCPLILDGHPLGVIFFSSAEVSTYSDSHIDLFSEISSGLALIIEQGLNKKSIQKNDSKDKVFRDTIHDLNHPLAVIKITLDTMVRKKWFLDLGEDSRKAFLILKRNCYAMVNLANDLTFEGEEEISALNCNLNSLDLFLNEVLIDGRILASKKNINITLNKKSNAPVTAVFDPFKLKEIMENLISNAIKYSAENTKFSINVEAEENKLYFSVVDEGQGIPESELPVLFTEYGKTSVRPTAGESSRGLGLSNVKRLVQAHHGNGFVTSEVGVGSSFGFWIHLSA